MKQQGLRVGGMIALFSMLMTTALSSACPAGDRAQTLLNRSFGGKVTLVLADLVDLRGCEGRSISGVAIVGNSQDGRGQARLYVNGQGVGPARSIAAQSGPTYFMPPPNVAQVDWRSLQLYLDGSTGSVYVSGVAVFFGDTFERRGH